MIDVDVVMGALTASVPLADVGPLPLHAPLTCEPETVKVYDGEAASVGGVVSVSVMPLLEGTEIFCGKLLVTPLGNPLTLS